jgi:hypothetical protein
MLREFIDTEFTTQIARRLGAADARLRAGLIGAQLFGLAIARYAVRLEPIASADHDTLVAWLGPFLQELRTGPAPPPSPGSGQPPARGQPTSSGS